MTDEERQEKLEREEEFLLQDVYKDDPWKFLVSCILLNQTGRRQVDRMRVQFFELCPNPSAAYDRMHADMVEYDWEEEEVMKLLTPLGLGKRRYKTISNLAEQMKTVLPTKAEDVMQFYGCGEYARDSWAIFVDGDLAVTPDDKELKKYLSERYTKLVDDAQGAVAAIAKQMGISMDSISNILQSTAPVMKGMAAEMVKLRQAEKEKGKS